MGELTKLIIKVICTLAFVALLIFVGNVIVIANQIQMATNVYCMYAFYAVVLALLLYFIIIPMIKIQRMPSITELSVDGDIAHKSLKNIADKLAECHPKKENKHYDDNELADIRPTHYYSHPKNQREFKEQIDDCGESNDNKKMELVKNEIKIRMKTIDDKIKRYGKHVFIVTAISQSNKLDTLSVLILNFRMIKDLIESTGFCPSFYQMFQIYWRVLVTGVFAYATSEVTQLADETIFKDIGTEVAGKIGSETVGKLLGILTKSFVDGAINGLFTLRLGYVTKHYLEKGFDSFKDKDTRIAIYKQSLNEAWDCRKWINETEIEIRKAS